jgi:hypothetical protein
MGYWTHYNHYNKYNNYGNDKMNIYLYNHITNIIENENFISIPMIYNYINYFSKNYSIIKPDQITFFENKKFCLMVNKSGINDEIQQYVNILSQFGEIDNINIYNDYINSKSCYHSVELLNVMNKYKFILCFENSYTDGYITEKIFNCLFARSIPIYKGSPIIEQYINKESFLQVDNIIDKINEIKNNEELFYNIINSNKISNNYFNENYEERLSSFIEKKLNKL